MPRFLVRLVAGEVKLLKVYNFYDFYNQARPKPRTRSYKKGKKYPRGIIPVHHCDFHDPIESDVILLVSIENGEFNSLRIVNGCACWI